MAKQKITFIKDHGDYKTGQTAEVDAGYASRLVCSCVAVLGSVTAPREAPAPEEPEIETAVSRPRTPRKRRVRSDGDQSS